MKKSDLRFAVGLVILALALRLFRIGAQSLWVDELLTLTMSSPDAGSTIWDYTKYNVHGPLHAFIVYLFHIISGSDGWLRVPSALAGAGTVYFVYRWGKVWLDERIARVTGLLLAIHPLHVYYSQEIRNYSMLLFFAAFASYQFHRILTSDRSRSLVAYVISMAAAALSNFSAAFVWVVHTALYLVRRRVGKGHYLRWAIMSLVILVLISPWVYRIYTFIDVSDLVTPVMPGDISNTERLRGETTLGWSSVPYTFYAFSVGFSLGPSLRELHDDPSLIGVLRHHGPVIVWVVALFGGLAVFGLWVMRRAGLPWFQVLMYLTLPIVLTLLLAWQNAKAFNVRYVLVALPGFLFMVAAGLVGLPARFRTVVTVLLAGTLLVSTGNYYFNGRFGREDVRAATRDMEARLGDDDCILAPTVTGVVEHYYTGDRPVHSIFAPPGTRRELIDRKLEPILTGCGSVWYIRARPWVDDPDGYLIGVLRREYDQGEVIEYNGVTLIHFER